MAAGPSRKEMSREKIVASAGALIREKGISKTSVADVMAGAGMTVGGFYAHFPSKQALVAETIREALLQSLERLEAYAGDSEGADRLRAVARIYLSRAHRDNPETGCPLPATAGDITREDAPVREALAEGLEHAVEALSEPLKETGCPDPRGEAIAALAAMVGGLTLARAVRGTPLSDEFLEACIEHITGCRPGGPD